MMKFINTILPTNIIKNQRDHARIGKFVASRFVRVSVSKSPIDSLIDKRKKKKSVRGESFYFLRYFEYM